jgi:hypothetical protein
MAGCGQHPNTPIASPLVESGKGGFREQKRWRVVKRVYWSLVFLFVF